MTNLDFEDLQNMVKNGDKTLLCLHWAGRDDDKTNITAEEVIANIESKVTEEWSHEELMDIAYICTMQDYMGKFGVYGVKNSETGAMVIVYGAAPETEKHLVEKYGASGNNKNTIFWVNMEQPLPSLDDAIKSAMAYVGARHVLAVACDLNAIKLID